MKQFSDPYYGYKSKVRKLKATFYYAINKLVSENLACVSGHVIFGCPGDKVVEALYRKIFSKFSGGCMLMDRLKVLSVGGWDENIHWGEDTELYYRLKKHGLVWDSDFNAVAYHPMTLKQYFKKAGPWGSGLAETYKRHPLSLRNLLLKRWGAIIIRPIHLALSVHPKLLFYYSIERIIYLSAFIQALKE